METVFLLTIQLKRQSLTESDDSEANLFEQKQVKFNSASFFIYLFHCGYSFDRHMLSVIVLWI